MKERVFVALSGGVDSAVCAALLREAGHTVVGVTMDHGVGHSAAEAAALAQQMGIEHHIVDIRQLFKEIVQADFIRAYAAGQTPNPCVLCNREIKFRTFDALIAAQGGGLFATGHYVQKVEEKGRYLLKKARFLAKDQTYVLYGLCQAQLQRTLFPLGRYSKEEVRQLAADFDLPVAQKSDSQDICFIPDGDYHRFLRESGGLNPEPGPIVEKATGKVLGHHKGLAYYTVGQRRGLGTALGYPAYVVALDPANNALVVGTETDLFSRACLTIENNFLPFDCLLEPLSVEVKIRYNSPPVQAVIQPVAEGVLVQFVEPQKAVAPGQSAVFYQGDYLIGGGKIWKNME